MRLLVVHDKPRHELGGMNDIIAAQGALLREAGWQLSELVCTPQAQPDSLHLAPSGRRLGLVMLDRLRGLLDRLQPDAVLLHSVYYALGPWALTQLGRQRPLIYQLHDVTPWCPRQTRLTRDGQPCLRRQGPACVLGGCYRLGEQGGWASDAHGLLMRALQQQAAQCVPQWLVPSHYLAGLLRQHGVAPSRIAVLPHFVAGLPPTPGPPQPGRLLFAGRLVAEKGLRLLLQALAQLQTSHWSLHVAGAGPERAALEALAAGQGWADRVRWCGRLSAAALAVEYAQAEVVVMPSLIPEAFGLVGLQAMGYGRPVVGFLSGGMAEWLRDGDNGRVASWGNAAALAQALDELLARPELARALGLRGRARAEQEFGAAAYSRRLQRLIEQCIARQGGGPRTAAPAQAAAP